MTDSITTRYAVFLHTQRHGTLLVSHFWNRAGAAKDVAAHIRQGRTAEVAEMAESQIAAFKAARSA